MLEALISLLWIVTTVSLAFGLVGGIAWGLANLLNWLGKRRKMATPK